MPTEPKSEYPEHDKLLRVSSESQAIGDFLEWLGQAKGVSLMTWVEQDEEVDCTGWLFSGCKGGKNDTGGRCQSCKGSGKKNRHFAGWVPQPQPITELLADHFEIDLKAIEREKRAMLERMREANAR